MAFPSLAELFSAFSFCNHERITWPSGRGFSVARLAKSGTSPYNLSEQNDGKDPEACKTQGI